MSRLPYLRRADLGPEGLEVWDLVVSTWNGAHVVDDGHLTGPFNALVHAPGPGLRLAQLGAFLREHSALDPRLLEIAIITIGARYRAEFEWWAHARNARAQGVSEAIISAIAQGEDPPFTSDDERIFYTVAWQLAVNGRLDEAIYRQAKDLLGDAGLVELITQCGYYTLISFALNAFDVPVPEGERREWTP